MLLEEREDKFHTYPYTKDGMCKVHRLLDTGFSEEVH